MAPRAFHGSSRNVWVWVVDNALREFVVQNPFEVFRRKIAGFANLKISWDSYGAKALSNSAISAAKKVIDELEKLEERDVRLDWVAPTSDESILLQHTIDGALHRWEFDSDGDIAVMEKSEEGEATYHDLNIPELQGVIERLTHAG